MTKKCKTTLHATSFRIKNLTGWIDLSLMYQFKTLNNGKLSMTPLSFNTLLMVPLNIFDINGIPSF